MYNPNPEPDDEYEYIEILNTGSTTVDIGGYQITDGEDTHIIPSGTMLQSRGIYRLEAGSTNNYDSDATLDGLALSNAGEEVQLLDESDNIIDAVTYNDTNAWDNGTCYDGSISGDADGGGESLQVQDPCSDNSVASNWTACSSLLQQSALPVELLSFTATPQADQVQISWSTASELNNDYFIVQTQDNNSEWIDLGMVQGAGTSSTVIEYRFMDDRRIAGDQFYRLMQVDLDGSITYSGVERVTITGTDLQWPTLVSNYLRTDIVGSYSIYSGQGQMIITEESIDGTVDVSSLSPGVYILRASGRTHRFIKQ